MSGRDVGFSIRHYASVARDCAGKGRVLYRWHATSGEVGHSGWEVDEAFLLVEIVLFVSIRSARTNTENIDILSNSVSDVAISVLLQQLHQLLLDLRHQAHSVVHKRGIHFHHARPCLDLFVRVRSAGNAANANDRDLALRQSVHLSNGFRALLAQRLAAQPSFLRFELALERIGTRNRGVADHHAVHFVLQHQSRNLLCLSRITPLYATLHTTLRRTTHDSFKSKQK